jgi:hypothetical protein
MCAMVISANAVTTAATAAETMRLKLLLSSGLHPANMRRRAVIDHLTKAA